MFHNEFYQTTPAMRQRMYDKIDGHPRRVLDPEAGSGFLIEGLEEKWRHHRYEAYAIEIDPNLQSILRGKGIKVLDSDFLQYQGLDPWHLIVMNPPFSNGDEHLLKALDVLYSGQILCLLNAETIRNPYTKTRKQLLRALEELGAEIEFHQDAFLSPDAERKTSVEVALIDVRIKRNIEQDFFANVTDAVDIVVDVTEKHEISVGFSIEELVAEYNQVVQAGVETIRAFFQNHHKVGGYFTLVDTDERSVWHDRSGSLTEKVEDAMAKFLVHVRRDFWRRTLSIKEVSKRLTEKKYKEFEEALSERTHADFTAANIRAFVLSVINSYEDTITEAVAEIFDRFSDRHSFHGGVCEKNIHYFNGWKTNSAFKVGKRVIIPVSGSMGEPFTDYNGRWSLDHRARRDLEDVDKVMNFFAGLGDNYLSISDALEEAFAAGNNKAVHSTFFTLNAYRKGTLHLTFKDEDILRKFNYVACAHKGFLPGNFGKTEYTQMTHEEQAVVNDFCGRETYEEHFGQPLFAPSQTLLLGQAA